MIKIQRKFLLAPRAVIRPKQPLFYFSEEDPEKDLVKFSKKAANEHVHKPQISLSSKEIYFTEGLWYKKLSIPLGGISISLLIGVSGYLNLAYLLLGLSGVAFSRQNLILERAYFYLIPKIKGVEKQSLVILFNNLLYSNIQDFSIQTGESKTVLFRSETLCVKDRLLFPSWSGKRSPLKRTSKFNYFISIFDVLTGAKGYLLGEIYLENEEKYHLESLKLVLTHPVAETHHLVDSSATIQIE